jgi:hypothetical protein
MTIDEFLEHLKRVVSKTPFSKECDNLRTKLPDFYCPIIAVAKELGLLGPNPLVWYDPGRQTRYDENSHAIFYGNRLGLSTIDCARIISIADGWKFPSDKDLRNRMYAICRGEECKP